MLTRAMGIKAFQAKRFEELLHAKKHAAHVKEDTELDADALVELVAAFKRLVREVEKLFQVGATFFG